MTNTANDTARDVNTRPREHTDEHTDEHTVAQTAARDDASHVTVPADSGIVGGGTPGDATDIGTASGTSNSGGG